MIGCRVVEALRRRYVGRGRIGSWDRISKGAEDQTSGKMVDIGSTVQLASAPRLGDFFVRLPTEWNRTLLQAAKLHFACVPGFVVRSHAGGNGQPGGGEGSLRISLQSCL